MGRDGAGGALWTVVVCLALASGLWSSAAGAPTYVLYDGSVPEETPADQGFFYLTRPSPPAAATASYAGGGTTLDTLGALGDLAGYAVRPGATPPLERASGFTLRFTVQLTAEQHLSLDRAGLSVLLLAEDQRGVELGLWPDEVWVQNDGAALFTHGEGAALDLASGPVDLALTVHDDSYTLLAQGQPLLSGPLRDYRDPRYPPQDYPFYYLPSVIFIGDNTSQAGAVARLFAVMLDGPPSDDPDGPPAAPTPTPPTPTATRGPVASPHRLNLPLVSGVR